jgi:hypothetical protein
MVYEVMDETDEEEMEGLQSQPKCRHKVCWRLCKKYGALLSQQVKDAKTHKEVFQCSRDDSQLQSVNWGTISQTACMNFFELYSMTFHHESFCLCHFCKYTMLIELNKVGERILSLSGFDQPLILELMEEERKRQQETESDEESDEDSDEKFAD